MDRKRGRAISCSQRTGGKSCCPRPTTKLLCRVGPGTPMGDVFRRFWHPVCLSEQIAGPDCDPVRVRSWASGWSRSATRRQARLAGRRLPASRRVAGARPQRGQRPALSLSRLEVRRGRHDPRHAELSRPAAGPEHQGQDLSDPRGGRFPVGLSRPGRQDAAVPDVALPRHPGREHAGEPHRRRRELHAAARRRRRHLACRNPPFQLRAAGLDDGRLQRQHRPGQSGGAGDRRSRADACARGHAVRLPLRGDPAGRGQRGRRQAQREGRADHHAVDAHHSVARGAVHHLRGADERHAHRDLRGELSARRRAGRPVEAERDERAA